jgi:ABC-type branched-subunit amino acid transport system ATPase component
VSEQPVLELRGVTRAFHGLLAVDGVDLAVDAGTVHGLIGPNGAGKTTLFNLISGLVFPTTGQIRYRGANITGWPAHRRARAGIQRVFQLTQLFRTLTVREHLLLSRPSGNTARWVEMLGLEPWLDRRPPQLPHGVARLAELAVTLAQPGHLVLLDEPAAGLTDLERERLGRIARRLVEDGRAVLVVEHDLAWTLDVVDRLTVLEQGRVIASGNPATVAQSPAVRRAYLGELSSASRPPRSADPLQPQGE